jgi:hypothetical protein
LYVYREIQWKNLWGKPLLMKMEREGLRALYEGVHNPEEAEHAIRQVKSS